MSDTLLVDCTPSILEIIEQRAAEGHRRVYCAIAKTRNAADGFQDMSYAALKLAIDAAAAYLDRLLGFATPQPKTFAFMAPPTDVRYAIFAFAAMRSGHRALFLSPRSPVYVQLSLLDTSDCRVLLHDLPTPLPAGLHGSDRPMLLECPPSLDELLGSSNSLAECPRGQWEQDTDRSFVILTTSGSTGLPKPVLLTQRWFQAIHAAMHSSVFEEAPVVYHHFQGKRIFCPFPCFHAASLALWLSVGVYLDMTIVSAHPAVPLSTSLVLDVLAHGNVETCSLPVSILADLSATPQGLHALSSLMSVQYGGSTLETRYGDLLAHHVHLISNLGLTECSILPSSITAKEDWSYLHFKPGAGFSFHHIHGDEYELVIQKTPSSQPLQAIFAIYPDLSEWNTKDLYSRHPSKQDHWMYRGRMDHLIVFQTGEKVNPFPFEKAMETHTSVKSAFLVGSGKKQAALFIEPFEDLVTAQDVDRLRREIELLLHATNKQVASHGRVEDDYVFVLPSSASFLRSAKGEILRRPTLDRLASYMDSIEDRSLVDKLPATKAQIEDEIRDFIAREKNTDINADADFFSIGLDSLHVIKLSRLLRNLTSDASIQPQTIYENPSLKSLLAALGAKRKGAQVEVRAAEQQALYVDAVSKLSAKQDTFQKDPCSTCVLLTGSTGSLGCYLLHCLSGLTEVSSIICSTRVSESLAQQLQQKKLDEQGLRVDFGKIRFQRLDLAKPQFGLPESQYDRLLQQVTHIIHCAWPVDFVRPLRSFRDDVRGTVELANLALSTKNRSKLIMLSTISAVMSGAADQLSGAGKIEEQIEPNFALSAPFGYSESKHVSENVLDVAASRGLCVRVLRIGQIAGSSGLAQRPEGQRTPSKEYVGVWNRKEWIPSLIRSSVTLGQIPGTLGSADLIEWIAADAVAAIVADITLLEDDACPSPKAAQVFHILNPSPMHWKDLLPSIVERYPSMQIAPLKDWTLSLRNAVQDTDDQLYDIMPAAKLIAFLETLSSTSVPCIGGGIWAEVANTTKASFNFRQRTLFTLGMMRQWLEAWSF